MALFGCSPFIYGFSPAGCCPSVQLWKMQESGSDGDCDGHGGDVEDFPAVFSHISHWYLSWNNNNNNNKQLTNPSYKSQLSREINYMSPIIGFVIGFTEQYITFVWTSHQFTLIYRYLADRLD